MKIKVTGNNCCKEKPYPKLMRSSKSGVIVLMGCHGEGTILSGTSTLALAVGDYLDHWDMNSFSDFEGTITLEN